MKTIMAVMVAAVLCSELLGADVFESPDTNRVEEIVHFDRMTRRQKLNYMQSMKRHNVACGGKVASAIGKTGLYTPTKVSKRHDPSWAMTTNHIERVREWNRYHGLLTPEERKAKWLERHPGQTEADYAAFQKMTRSEKIAWLRKWREDHPADTSK